MTRNNMPIYEYQNSCTGEIVKVIQSMREQHTYVRDGVEWIRLWSNPQTVVDTKWDSLDPKDFIRKTKQKKGTVGNLWEKSAELAEIRAKKMGKDFLFERHLIKEKERRKGKLTPYEFVAGKNKVISV